MATIPNQLNITINTSIPGFQKVIYKPSMTLDNISSDDNSVIFNPLIKLNKSVIDKIPENLRIKEFFNKGLFQSLLNYTNAVPEKSLTLATRYGYVDNNIKITLQTIFPPGSVIKIGKKPYVIADVQWTSGDWKIDTKQKKEEINVSRITDPYLYQSIVGENLISGEQQLQNLPPDLAYGSNFTGARGVPATGVPPVPAPVPVPVPVSTGVPSTTSKVPIPTPRPSVSPPPVPAPAPVPPALPGEIIIRHIYEYPQPPPGGWPQLPPPPPEGWPPLPPPPIPGSPPPVLALPPIDIDDIADSGRISELNEEDYHPAPEVNLVANTVQSRILKPYFRSNYYFLLNIIYQNFPSNIQRYLNQILRTTTNVYVQEGNTSLSKDAYLVTVDGLRVNKNAEDGNCFFQSVADAINLNNFNNPLDNRIIHGVYGRGSTIFTQLSIRQFIGEYYSSLPNLDEYFVAATNYASDLNMQYSRFIQEQTDAGNPVDYLVEAKRIYREEPHFLVKFPEEDDIDRSNLANTFRVIGRSEVKDYILSPNYWAGQETLLGLIETLNINTIIIVKNQDNTFSVYNSGNLNSEYFDNWDKYVFLYYTPGHYELMTFKYINVNWGATGKPIGPSVTKTVGLFFRERHFTGTSILPPLYILFLMYVTSYRSLTTEEKANYSIFQDLMNIFDITLYKIASSPTPPMMTDTEWVQTLNRFSRYFSDKFPHNQPFQRVDVRPLLMSGGQIKPMPRPIQRYQQPYYGKPYYAENMVKKNQEYDTSKLAYSITIYMELYPGTSIPEEEMKKLQCNSKWNAVKKAWADFTGKPYVITPVYSMLYKNKTQNNRNIKNNRNNGNIKKNNKQGGGTTTRRKI